MNALVAALLLANVSAAPAAGALRCDAAAWPEWDRYAQAFVATDGRVIDHTARERSTSEGQAYGLFFALVAGDRAAFARILRWSGDNLARGDLAAHLPAWHWGQDRHGRWTVLDPNPASDADLWMAYTLLEASRLWGEPRLDRLARAMLAQVAAHEVSDLPGLGPTLLPAPTGFVLERGRAWRLNPSYAPPQLLRRLEAAGVPGPWGAVREAAARTVRAGSRRGAVADWVTYRRAGGFGPDPVRGPIGSYDAIRVYLWLGMLPRDGEDAPLAAGAQGLLDLFRERGELPEAVDVRSLRGRGHAPVGFYAALAPLAQASGDARAAGALEARVAAALHDGLYGSPPAYYDQNLVLFAHGFLERRYRFERDGRLTTAWEGACEARGR